MFNGKDVPTINDPQGPLIRPTIGIHSVGVTDRYDFILNITCLFNVNGSAPAETDNAPFGPHIPAIFFNGSISASS
jgi:hypothetical protein